MTLRRDGVGGFPDDATASGPTVVARATLAAVAGWFDGVDAAEMERRLRPNLVVSGVEPFWEDRLYADRESVVAFRVGAAEFLGSNLCRHSVVPTRDPETGEVTPGFRERFGERRRETLPEWPDDDWFDGHLRLMVDTSIPERTVGAELRVGDEWRYSASGPARADPPEAPIGTYCSGYRRIRRESLSLISPIIVGGGVIVPHRWELEEMYRDMVTARHYDGRLQEEYLEGK